jgi:hypothetical protein
MHTAERGDPVVSGRLRRRSGRLLLALLTTIALAACGAATGVTGNGGPLLAAAGTPSGGGTERGFHDPSFGLTFKYPAAWEMHPAQGWDGSLFSMIVFLSNQRLQSPCTIRHGQHSTTISCHSPLKHLAPGGILASWGEGGRPGWSLGRVPGVQLRVDGRPAKLQVTASGCGIGANKRVDVTVARHVAENYFEFSACMRAPGIQRMEQDIHTLLHTVRFRES